MLKANTCFYIFFLLYAVTNLPVPARPSTPQPQRPALTKRQRTKATRAFTILSTKIRMKPDHPRAPLWLENLQRFERKLGRTPNQELPHLIEIQQKRRPDRTITSIEFPSIRD